MALLNQMTIKTRMILAFTLMALLFLLFGLISISQMGRLSQLTQTLYDHPLRVSNAALRAKAGVISMHRSMKDVSTSHTQLSITMAIQTVQNEEKKVYAEMETILEFILGEEGKKLARETTEMFARWKPIRVEVEELVLRGDLEGANRITREKGADYVARLELKMSALTTYAVRKADGFMADAGEVESGIFNNAIFFIILMIFAGVGIGYLVSSSILSSVSDLKENMTAFTGSEKLEQVRLKGRNEITEMAGHFNMLILRLKRQFWLGDGQNELNKTLFGELTYDEILEKSIRTVCRYTDACAGALYRFNETDQVCELKSSYALVERTHLANRFRLGQGIVGQVAVEKSPILLTDIVREDAVGRSGTVNEPPLAIYALPLFHKNVLYGILEVASFTPIDQIKKDYLESAANIISTALHTAFQNDRIKELLSVSQGANEELQIQAEELQALNEEFQQQSHELKIQNLALEDQRAQVEEANQLKSEFLSNMSHELRTPLNSVNALSRVLLVQAKEKLSPEELDYLTIIERNGKHLLTLINDILDLSKIEAGRMEVSRNRFSLNIVLDTILDSIEPLACEKGILLERDISSDLPEMISDESRVYQIFQNIIANAVKFTEKGHVRVSVNLSESGRVRVRVEDTGLGISADDLGGIFEEFRQVDGASTRQFEGTGLGLSIAYKSAKLLGGDIRVESTPDKGSVFSIFLPVRYQESSPPVPDISFPKQVLPGKITPILVVDDDPDMLETISSALTGEGYDCITADSGKTALKMAREHRPAAITLDIMMPDKDGWEVLGELKKDPATSDIPVIIVSQSQDHATGFALGAVGYVTKPIRHEVLIAEINKLFTSPPSRILVVDDNATDLEQTARMIERQGMEVLRATDGRTCIEILKTDFPDMVILDLVMPGMDGFEVLRHIRSMPETAHLPVIIVTAKDLTLQERQVLESRVSSVLTKGTAEASELAAKIKAILANIGRRVEPGRAAVSAPEPDEKHPGRILLVEDNGAAVIQVRTALEALGFRVDIARNGRQAIDRVTRQIPDGIILDLMMPDVDGFQVLESIRSTPETREIPVLILTAKDLTARDMEKLSGNNVHHLIQKGDVNQEELVRCVRRMVSPSGEAARVEKAPLVPVRPDTGRKPLILVMEDNPDNMTTIKAILGRTYAIIGVTDGKQGIDRAIAILPDLILLDIALPVMDGFAVVKALKAHDKTRKIPVIALTAQAMKGDRERILNAGCDDYIAKPIDPDVIIETLESRLGRKREMP